MATRLAVCGTASTASNCRKPPLAISARMPPTWGYNFVVEVPRAPTHLAGLQRIGPVVVEQPDGGMRHLIPEYCVRAPESYIRPFLSYGKIMASVTLK